jgi:hypothetical protein
VEAAEQRGHRVKKTLEIDPIQAETVRLIFRLAREGDGSSGPMGVKSITKRKIGNVWSAQFCTSAGWPKTACDWRRSPRSSAMIR